jgi:hypothetical protein
MLKAKVYGILPKKNKPQTNGEMNNVTVGSECKKHSNRIENNEKREEMNMI